MAERRLSIKCLIEKATEPKHACLTILAVIFAAYGWQPDLSDEEYWKTSGIELGEQGPGVITNEVSVCCPAKRSILPVVRKGCYMQTGYLYHWVPTDLKGHTLYPLNQLKSVDPSLYVTKAAKYQNREALMQAHVPLLDCLWNDVIHFSPVHPSKIHHGLAEAGFVRRQLRYFEVDPLEKGFNATNAVIFLHQRIKRENFQFQEEDFEVFSLASLSSLGEIPEATTAYYREMFEQGKRPLVYLYVPHILYQGRLDISDVRVIEVF